MDTKKNSSVNLSNSVQSLPRSLEGRAETLEPKEALARLLEGNRRFVGGIRSVDSLMGHSKMADLAKSGQRPFAVVLTCSDSRSPAELIFDQGIGDLFVVRVAGNVIAPSLLASIEFAVANFGSSIVLVLGHTLCGAVSATVKFAADPSKGLPSPHLEELVGRVRPAVEAATRECSPASKDFERLATTLNVRRTVRLISEQSKIVRTLEEEGKLLVRGALLDISTGSVELT